MPLGQNVGLYSQANTAGVLQSKVPGIAVGGFDPTLYGTVAGWYKADALVLSNGATVSSWTDSSSSNIPFATDRGAATFQTNQQNGLPAVSFGGAASLVRNGMSFNGFCVATVFKRLDATISVLLAADDNVNQTYNTPNTFLAGFGNGATLGIGHNSAYNSGSNLATTQYYIHITNCDNAGNMASYVNGSPYVTVTTGSGVGTSVKLRLAYRLDTTGYFTGYIGETIIYNTGLTSTNITNLSNKLNQKWGIY